MNRGLIACAVAVFSLVVFLNSNTEGGGKKDPVAIKVVMQKAMKGGLCAKVAKGEASEDEKKELVALFTDLAANKCPKGDEEDWTKRTKALLDAAKAGDAAALKKAANCAACHKQHK